MSRLSQKAITELLTTMPNPETSTDRNRYILQLQRKVSVQDKLIQDLSHAITRIQQQLYALNQTPTKKG